MIALRGVLNMYVEKYHSNTRGTIYMNTHLSTYVINLDISCLYGCV